MEDVYHLTRLLAKSDPSSLESLDAAFTAFTQLRLPIVSDIVSRAKKEGMFRVTSGEEGCKRRDEMLSKPEDRELTKVQMKAMMGPFEGESEI